MRQLLPVAQWVRAARRWAEFLRASVGGILRSTGAAAADQPWRNPSLAARVRRPFRILGWKRCASAL